MALTVCGNCVALAMLLQFSLLGSATADAFLRARSAEEATGGALRDALEAALGVEGHRAATARLGRLEDALRPTFASLPKNGRGAVDAASARYALHRLFVQRHGWQMSGLHPAGESWASESPAAALGDRVQGHVKQLFDGQLSARGLDLGELALLAATLEQLVHSEAVQRLEASYLAFGWEGSTLSSQEAAQVIDAYMVSYILGANTSELSAEKVKEQLGGIEQVYPSWPETVVFLREVQQEVARGAESFTFVQVAAVVEEVGERYGRWQQFECHALKDQLMKMESGNGTGRVRLADFYSGALHDGQWQFSESTEYLRHLGALDESDPRAMSVIIPNYINGPSNCVASGGYYSVCCIDECEALMGALEARVAAPEASSSEVLSIISDLPSSSVAAGRTLSSGLKGRLEEVAAHHGGRVPLHGRLFAQWMHLAYPRECPYPHVSGTTSPQRPEAWEAKTGQQVSASEDEMAQHFEASKAQPRSAPSTSSCEDGVCGAMWTMEEELVATHAPSQAQEVGKRQAAEVARAFALFGAVFAVALGLVGSVRQAMTALDGAASAPAKYAV